MPPVSKTSAINKLSELNYEMVNPEEYKTTNTRTDIKCLTHNIIWESTVGDAYRGAKICPECRSIMGDWKEFANEKNYTIVNEDGIYATFKCTEGHEWKTQKNHVKFTLCKWCSGKRISIESIVEKIKSRGFELLNIDEIETTRSKGKFKCAKGHEWECQTHNVYDGKSGCPHCSTTTGERRCRFILETIFEKPFCKTRSVVVIADQRLELDMYNEELRIACEYNGIQHYICDPNYFHKYGGFEEQRERDLVKRNFCLDNGIHLIEVPYTSVRFQDTVGFIISKLHFSPKINWAQKEIEFNSLDDNNAMSTEVEVNEWTEAAGAKGGKFIKSQSNGKRMMQHFECSKGHAFSLQPSDVRRGRWCHACSGRMPLTAEVISDQLASVDMTLESSFLSSGEQITIKCINCDSEYDTCWDNCKQRELKKGCRECASSSKKLDKMQSKLTELGLVFKDKLYVDAKTKYKFECMNGHPTEGNWNAIKIRKNGCKQCK